MSEILEQIKNSYKNEVAINYCEKLFNALLKNTLFFLILAFEAIIFKTFFIVNNKLGQEIIKIIDLNTVPCLLNFIFYFACYFAFEKSKTFKISFLSNESYHNPRLFSANVSFILGINSIILFKNFSLVS